MSEKCDHVRKLMLDALTVPLSPEKRSDVQRHVKGCVACREYEAALEADDRLLSDFTGAMRPAIAGIETAVMETLWKDRRRLPPAFWGRRMGWVAAAVIACGILALVGSLLLPLSTSTVTLAETLESMRHVPWIHVVQRPSPGDADAYEYWECVEARTRARKMPGGKITYANYAENVMYSYNPNANKVTVSFTTDSYMLGPQWNPVERLADAIERSEEVDVRVTRRTAVENGTRLEQIRIERDANPLARSVVYTRDVERNLLLQQETTVRKDGQATVYTTTFDYPGVGPANIHALGVPQGAAVLDIRPEGPALALADQVQERFERGFGDYLAVVLESWVGEDGTRGPSGITVLRQQGNLKRADIYHAYDFQGRPDAPRTLYARIKDDWPDLTTEQVLEVVDANALERQMLFDGEKTIQWRRDRGQLIVDEDRTDPFKILQAPWAHSLTSLIWPNLHLRLQSGSSQFKREVRLLPEDPNHSDLVGLQFVGFAEREDYWFDPGKDDMQIERVKKQEGKGVVSRFLVAQAAQTPDGRWYPRVLEMESSSSNNADPTMVSRREWRVLLDASPTFDDGVFVSSVAGTAERNEPPAQSPEKTAEQVEPQDDEQPVETGLRGLVKDEQGRLLSDATVLLYYTRSRWGLGNKVTQITQSDPNGRFMLAESLRYERNEPHAFAQDSYILLALHPDYACAWQNIRQGRQDKSYELTLTAPTTRVITVIDHNDNPLAGARVWLHSAGDPTSTNPLFRDYLRLRTDIEFIGTTTDVNGNATMTNLPATACWFDAGLKGYATGLAFSNQDRIRLSPSANVSGWVVTDAGKPVEGATISCSAAWMNSSFLVETDSQGRFELIDLPSPGWDMSPWEASADVSGAYTLRLKHTDYAVSDQTIELLPGQAIDNMVIEVAAETTLVRCLVVEEGTDIPVPGARIAGQAEGLHINGYSDANGVFEIRVMPGPVNLRLHSPPDGVYVGRSLHSSGDYRVGFEAQGEQMDIVLKSPPIEGRLVNVPGVVLGPEGVPVTNVVVYASAGEFYAATVRGLVRSMGADSAGHFELKEVPAGRDLHIYAETKDHRFATTEVAHIPAEANEPAPLGLVLQPTRNAVVVLEDEDGHLVSDRSVCLRPASDGATSWSAQRYVKTDSLGVLEIEGIIPGLTYFLRDARFENVVGPMPEGCKEWFQGKSMVLIPLEP